MIQIRNRTKVSPKFTPNFSMIALSSLDLGLHAHVHGVAPPPPAAPAELRPRAAESDRQANAVESTKLAETYTRKQCRPELLASRAVAYRYISSTPTSCCTSGAACAFAQLPGCQHAPSMWASTALCAICKALPIIRVCARMSPT
jgi:hypothetical protein